MCSAVEAEKDAVAARFEGCPQLPVPTTRDLEGRTEMGEREDGRVSRFGLAMQMRTSGQAGRV